MQARLVQPLDDRLRNAALALGLILVLADRGIELDSGVQQRLSSLCALRFGT